MRQIITLSILVSLFLFSCQKESGFSDNNSSTGGGGNTAGTKLIKVVAKAGTDSSVSIYSYNSSGKLIGIISNGVDGGSPIYNSKIIIRNNQGIIQKVVMKDADFIQAGIDSIEYKVRYDVSASRYTGWTVTIDDGFDIRKDSVVYIYNSAGKVITESGYGDGGTGTYRISGKIDYTHSGNNIVTKKVYSYDQGVYRIDFTVTDEFDTKTAPLILGIEGLLIEANSLAPYYSANNITKETVTYPSDPTETLTITYTYNSTNKPATASYNFQSGSQVLNLFSVSYYYQ